jgi:hypothetical protein
MVCTERLGVLGKSGLISALILVLNVLCRLQAGLGQCCRDLGYFVLTFGGAVQALVCIFESWCVASDYL